MVDAGHMARWHQPHLWGREWEGSFIWQTQKSARPGDKEEMSKGSAFELQKKTQSPWLQSIHFVQEHHQILIQNLAILRLRSGLNSSPTPFLVEIRVRRLGAENQRRRAKAYIHTDVHWSCFRYSKTLGKPKFISDWPNKLMLPLLNSIWRDLYMLI